MGESSEDTVYRDLQLGISFSYHPKSYSPPYNFDPDTGTVAKNAAGMLRLDKLPRMNGTANGYVNITNAKDSSTSYLDEEYEKVSTNGLCTVTSRGTIAGQKSLWYQCAEMGDSEMVIVSHPKGGFLKIEGTFTGDAFRDLVQSLKFVE